MRKFTFLIIISFLVGTKECQSHKEKKNIQQQETDFEREEYLIDEYHRQSVISKGKETFFIPREEIHWYFKNDFFSIEDAQVDDNISFFDTLGNIEYQAIVAFRKAEKIIVKCQDLSNAEYYITELNPDSIRDLKKDYPYLIKAYRHK